MNHVNRKATTVKYNRLRTIITLFSAGLICLTFSACWLYSFKGTLPPDIKNIAIPIFTDRTAEFNIQQTVTDKIRLGFIKENMLKLVEEDNAHSVLYGTILSIDDRPLVYTESTAGESVTEYRLTIKIEIEWYDKVNSRSIFKKQFVGYSEYDPTGASDLTRDTALTESISQIIEDIMNSILADW
ncbi:MAG: LptE family protein [Candidatus Neomarinimicrobiota bacterium]